METRPVHILSVGTAVPGLPIDNARLARRFGMTETWRQWVDTFVGAGTRHLSVDLDTGEPRWSLTDLAATAAQRALDAAGLAGPDVDLVVMGTATPDQLMPTTATMVADRLGIDGVPAFQLQSGCSGAVQALQVAHQFLASGTKRTALVIGADTTAKYFDTTADLSTLPPAQLVNFLLFGDAAGAVVLGTGAGRGARALVHRVGTTLTGLGREPGQTLRWYGPADRGEKSQEPAIGENYKEIEESVPPMAAEIARVLLADLDWQESEVDYLLPPQLSARMSEKILPLLGFPAAEEIACVTETGNTGNALPFLQLERALDEMVPGDRALGIAVESSKWIRAGFAVERV
ncbi:3-oxoacyl-ACP synthase III family protein [Streptomyces sp. NPDC020983]|uniref:3-oxoacyl-ACP synthase III family protein n=1 Tax=Streptomyces sp. NPDC020983 TaxID=3365106 RepID=UPI0037B10E99